MRALFVLIPLLVCAAPSARAEGARGEIEAYVDVPGLDGARFVEDLARRTRLTFSLRDGSATVPGRARLEISFDAARSLARVAFHDGTSDAPALVVLAEIAESRSLDGSWFLLQAEAAIRNFSDCESDMGGPSEVLNPWSPSDTAHRQRWAEVLDPWLGCKGDHPRERPSSSWPELLDGGDPILQGEVLDPWAEAAYEERPVALSVPRPGAAPRRLKSEEP